MQRVVGGAAAAAAGVVLLRPYRRAEPEGRFEAARCEDCGAAVRRLRAEGFAVVAAPDPSRFVDVLDAPDRRRRAVEVTRGRLHCELSGRPGDADADAVLADVERSVAAPLAALAAAYLGRRDLALTQAQFLDSAPGADAQSWHRDNAAPGITFLLPLAPVRADMGPTEVLPRSHRGGAPLDAAARPLRCGPLRPGDCLAYDARLLHRGGANASDDPRRVLVLRYDSPATPPPGVGLAGALGQRARGRARARLAEVLYDLGLGS